MSNSEVPYRSRRPMMHPNAMMCVEDTFGNSGGDSSFSHGDVFRGARGAEGMSHGEAIKFLPVELIERLQEQNKRKRKTSSPLHLHEYDGRNTLASACSASCSYVGLAANVGNSFKRRNYSPHVAGCSKSTDSARCSTGEDQDRSSPPRLTLSAFRRPETVRLINDVDKQSSTRDPRTTYEFSSGRVLGHGASSTVRLATRRVDGAKVAVKCIPKHEILRDYRRLDEFKLLQHISHPHIVQLHDVYETESDLCLVMELCTRGDLYTRIVEVGIVPEDRVRRIVRRLLAALQYLHDMNIVHRDVKLENILLGGAGPGVGHEEGRHDDDTFVKLTDFGLAKRMQESADAAAGVAFGDQPVDATTLRGNRSRTYSRVGSDYYSAPEVNSGGGYDTAVDLYSLGVCAHILLCGNPPKPPSERLPGEVSANREHRLFRERQWATVSHDAKDLVKSLLSCDPDDRPTAAEALQHSWFATAVGHNAEANKTHACEESRSYGLSVSSSATSPLLVTVPFSRSRDDSSSGPLYAKPPSSTHSGATLPEVSDATRDDSSAGGACWRENPNCLDLQRRGQDYRQVPRVTPR